MVSPLPLQGQGEMATKPDREPPTLPSDLVARFEAIVGKANALTEPDAQSPYLHEPRELFVGQTPLVLRPGTTEQVSEILKLANDTGTAIVPQGGNTGLVGGQIPAGDKPEVVVSLSRLNRVRHVDPEGGAMTLEAGVTLANAQAAADSANRLFPLSLGSQSTCQVGGNLATNAGGVGVLAYGNARELTLGLEVVLADGRIWDGLRSLRKDNTGYDLRDLFVGSEGTLGIITAAVLKIFPKPKGMATAFAALNSLDNIARFFELAHDAAGPDLTAFEIIPDIGIEFVLRHAEGTRHPLSTIHPWYVLLEISARGAAVDAADAMEAIFGQALEAGLIEDAVLASSLTQTRDFWTLRERMSDVQKQEGGSIKSDVSVPVAHVPEFIRRAGEMVEGLVPGARPVPFGHFGDGNIHYNISQPVGAERQEFLSQWDRVTDAINQIVLELNGSISAEHGIGRLKRALLAEVKSDVELDLMRTVKHALDPNGILNPGRVI